MNLDAIDFFPGYDPGFRQRRRNTCCISLCTHFLAMALAVAVCLGGSYYYEIYMKNQYGDIYGTGKLVNKYDKPDIRMEMKNIKDSLSKTDIWRKHLFDLFSKIYLQQESLIDSKIARALDIYDSDKIGIFDYASTYACGIIVSTPDTFPYPANKTISFFNLLNVDVLSTPEAVLQPNNLPGNCFAFYGTTGRIRIKLGKRIPIRAVTLDHVKLMEDAGSAPRDFEVFGLYYPLDINGVFLGRFTYNLKGRPYQTFKIRSNITRSSFEYVELHILSNYGRRDYTCVYRFRVHNEYLSAQNRLHEV